MINWHNLFKTQSDLNRLRGQADVARDARDWRHAAELYEEVLVRRPNDGDMRVQAGHMRKEAGDLAKAEQHYLHARALMPDDADLSLQLGHYYKVADRPLEALAAYRRAIALDPSNADARAEHDVTARKVRAAMGAPESISVEEETRILQPIVDRAAKITMDDVRVSRLFDGSWYLKKNPDIARMGVDPLLHFFEYGRHEGRRPGPHFEADWYVAAYPEVLRSGLDPFTHYLAHGRDSGMRPSGPPMYERWVARFDSLTERDYDQMDRHIAALGLPRPQVLLHVDQLTGPFLSAAVAGLRRQRLKPQQVLVILGRDVAPSIAEALTALVGNDDLFRVVPSATVDREFAIEGSPVVLMDAGAELREHALYLLVEARSRGASLVYGDEDCVDENGVRYGAFFKPDASPELIRQMDFLGACVLSDGISIDLAIDAIRTGSTTLSDLVRRAFLATPRNRVDHVPHVIFHDRATGQRPQAGLINGAPSLPSEALPTVTIIIPTRDRLDLLSVCIDSLLSRTDYPEELLDIVVVDNGSVEPDTIEYLAAAPHRRFRVLHDASPFNYARLNNRAAEISTSEVLVLLNNDTEITDPEWLRGLVRYAMQPDIGAVGPKLLYEDGTIQHAGVVLGIGVAAAHAHVGLPHDAAGVFSFAQKTREVAAVTGACLAIRRQVFEEIGGLDEHLKVAFNDVDLCLTAAKHGYRNLYVHDVWMRHFESKSRGVDDTFEKVDLFITEANYARRKHLAAFASDPFYNPNLSVLLDSFYEPAFPPRARYPWRDHARLTRSPRVLLLASLIEANSEIGIAIVRQAAALVDGGYDVSIGMPRRLDRLAVPPEAHVVLLADQAAAASYAVEREIDAIVTHTAGFAGVSRLVGGRPVVVVHHHGFAVEARSAIQFGRDEKVAIKLALPAAAEILVSSAEAERELEQPARLLRPGGDRIGSWNGVAEAERSVVRARHGWEDRIVVLIDPGDSLLKPDQIKWFRDVAERLDLSRISFLSLRDVSLPGGYDLAPTSEGRAALLAAADLLWQPSAGGSPLLAAEAAAFGLPLLADSESIDPARSAVAIAEIMVERDAPRVWKRRSDAAGWGEILNAFVDVVDEQFQGAQSERHTRPGSAQMLLSPDRLIADSGLFDASAYLQFNRDVAAAKIDPWEHFKNHGGIEGRRPSYLFDTMWYLQRYPEVAQAKISPLAHYLSNPTGDYNPNPYFDNASYIARYPDVAGSGLSPLVHYLQTGAAEGRSIGAGFDAEFYRRIHPDVEVSGMLPFVHFMKTGDGEGRLPIKPARSPIDIFDDAEVATLIGGLANVLIPQATAGEVIDRRSAARYVISLLRCNAEIRARFPNALSSGAEGDFARWIDAEGATTLGLGERARYFVRNILGVDFAARVRQAYLVRTDLRRLMPFALLPDGAGSLITWGMHDGVREGFSLEEVWWLALLCREDPTGALITTYSFSPSWQFNHRMALTVFGAASFLSWLRREFDIDPPFEAEVLAKATLPADAIRIAWQNTASWQHEHPAPFKTVDSASTFLDWLGTSNVALPREALAWTLSLDRAAVVSELVRPGVNMIGHFCYPSGLKTSTEALVKGADEAGLSFTERDIWVQQPGDENNHWKFRGWELFDTTIMLCQPEPLFDVAYARAGLAPRTRPPYMIGYWYWEQEEIPDQWLEQVAKLDEIWTSTHFVGDALKKKIGKPVQVIPHGIELQPYERRTRSFFALPEDHFLFLFTFHMMSVMERKNPLGLIEAFRKQFRPGEKVGLVLKTSFGDHHPRQMEELRRAAAGANITIIDSVYSKADILALMDSCDAYVSLHRSEGFGLTMAEAMLVGRPTIATGYSANLDFMTPENSLLVDYDLITLDRDYPPYKAGSRWAKASLDHAGQCMRRLVEDREYARALGKRGREDLQRNMSFLASGRMIVNRLAEIDRLRSADASRSTGLIIS